MSTLADFITFRSVREREAVEKKDGSGDLVFEEERGGHPKKDIRRGFLHLPDLHAAERELRKAVTKSR